MLGLLLGICSGFGSVAKVLCFTMDCNQTIEYIIRSSLLIFSQFPPCPPTIYLYIIYIHEHLQFSQSNLLHLPSSSIVKIYALLQTLCYTEKSICLHLSHAYHVTISFASICFQMLSCVLLESCFMLLQQQRQAHSWSRSLETTSGWFSVRSDRFLLHINY